MKIEGASIRALSSAVRSGKLDPVTLVEYRLAQIDRQNGKLNALRHVDRKASLERAKKIAKDRKQGALLGALAGITYSAKDHLDVAGQPKSEGSRVGEIPSAVRSCAAVERLAAEHAICIGKANMSQYGKSFVTENDDFGRTVNPFDPEFVPGGSGGGDAAAVAAGLADFGLGVDAAGSVRVPANFCGLFGLKPTNGVISSAGMSSYQYSTRVMFRSIGPVARSLDDLEIVFQTLAGFDPLDPTSVACPASMRFGQGPGQAARKRFLWFSEMNGIESDPQIQKALEDAAARLERLGWKGERRCPAEWRAAYEVFIVLVGQASLLAEDLLATQSGSPRDLNAESKLLKGLRQKIAQQLPPLSTETLLQYWHRTDSLRLTYAEASQDYDLILCPVGACLPFRHGSDKIRVGTRDLAQHEALQFAAAPSVLGLPAVAFPTSLSPEGLPVGLQIVGKRFSEFALFGVLRELGYLEGLSRPTP